MHSDGINAVWSSPQMAGGDLALYRLDRLRRGDIVVDGLAWPLLVLAMPLPSSLLLPPPLCRKSKFSTVPSSSE